MTQPRVTSIPTEEELEAMVAALARGASLRIAQPSEWALDDPTPLVMIYEGRRRIGPLMKPIPGQHLPDLLKALFEVVEMRLAGRI